MDLDSVADELYGLTPSDFTARRDARAAEAGRADDRELAAAIKSLRRPTSAAWLANILVRERHDRVVNMLQLGAALRDAQARLANTELRSLSKEGRRGLAVLVDDALHLARDRSEAVSGAVSRGLRETLEAALLDPTAASALAAGRLTAALRYSGLGGAGPTNNAGSEASGQEPATSGQVTTGPDRVHVDQDRTVVTEAALREAESAAAEAEHEVGEHEHRAQRASQERERLHEEVADLERQLGEAQAAELVAERRFMDAEAALEAAERKLRCAQGRLADLREALNS
jgi:hypothetical protein